jgi:hypothetical protein
MRVLAIPSHEEEIVRCVEGYPGLMSCCIRRLHSQAGRLTYFPIIPMHAIAGEAMARYTRQKTFS